MVIGGVVPVFNVEGIKPGGLNMTGALIADIYLGKVSKWNAPEIVALNKGVKLPNQDITVVHLGVIQFLQIEEAVVLVAQVAHLVGHGDLLGQPGAQ